LVKILWIPHAAWRIPQRAHHFCRALAERHEVHVTDWGADFYTWRDYLSLRYPRNFLYRLSRDGRITVHGIPRISPALYSPILRRWNARIFSAVVDRIIRRHRIDAVVGTFVVPPPQAPRLVFDLFDDNVAYWRQYGRGKAYLGEIETVEYAYLQAADAVVAASSVLADKAKLLTSRPVHRIPNAVDLKQFTADGGIPWRKKWNAPGIWAGVLGNYDKPDELQNVLETAAVLRGDDISFIIAGRGASVPGARAQAAKRGLTKVKFVGEIPLPDSADVVSAFDVGLCPYRKTPFADACSPMRLLLYTAAGLPTVCTNLEEVRRMNFPNVVLVEDDPESAAEGIRRARTMPRARPDAITAYDLPRLAEQYERLLRG
jgi:hypothetical protein